MAFRAAASAVMICADRPAAAARSVERIILLAADLSANSASLRENQTSRRVKPFGPKVTIVNGPALRPAR